MAQAVSFGVFVCDGFVCACFDFEGGEPTKINTASRRDMPSASILSHSSRVRGHLRHLWVGREDEALTMG